MEGYYFTKQNYSAYTHASLKVVCEPQVTLNGSNLLHVFSSGCYNIIHNVYMHSYRLSLVIDMLAIFPPLGWLRYIQALQ